MHLTLERFYFSRIQYSTFNLRIGHTCGRLHDPNSQVIEILKHNDENEQLKNLKYDITTIKFLKTDTMMERH